MNDVLDSGSFRVVGYLVVAGVALVWGQRERARCRVDQLEWWPTYWWTSALLLTAMAIARAGSFGDVIGELGREQARSSGWYDARRTLQAAAVIVLAIVWLIGVIVAVWRVPPRRRRYLPHAIGVSGLVGFATVRVISLHQIDTVLYRRDVAGIRIVALLELALLAATAGAGLATARIRRRTGDELPTDGRYETVPAVQARSGEQPT